jgi:hypothetical protein
MLERRCGHLADRLDHWGRGDRGYTRAELYALRYALHVIRAASAAGLIDELEAGFRMRGNGTVEGRVKTTIEEDA